MAKAWYQAAWLQAIGRHAPPLNFITLHYTYFFVTCLLAGIILWVSSTPLRSVSFTDALFLAVSAMTEAGLNTINLSALNTFQQIVLFLLIMMGSPVGVSATVIYIRRRAFQKHFAHIVEEERKARMSKSRSFNKNQPIRAWTRSRGPIKITNATEIRTTTAVPEVDGVVVRGRTIPVNHVMSSEDTPQEIQSGDTSDTSDENRVNTSQGKRPDENPNKRQSSSPESSPPVVEADTAIPKTQDNDNNEVARDHSRRRAATTIRFEDAGNLEKQPHSYPAGPLTTTGTDTVASPRRPRLLSMSGVGARPDLLNHPKNAAPPYNNVNPDVPNNNQHDLKIRSDLGHDWSLSGVLGRNSQISSLSDFERAKLGGVEYRALRFLEILVPLYFFLFQFFGAVGVAAWTASNAADVTIANGLNPVWVGVFNAVSAFNNSGMSLLDANMVAFQDSVYLLLTMSLLILAGNTCFPVFLRLICWSLWKITPSSEPWIDTRVALRFVLDHPRRVYTNLFPAYHTWFLLASVIVLNVVDWLAFEILNIGNPYVGSLPPNIRVLDGLFQAFAVRSGGFYVVPIASIAIGVQVLYVLMMYISVYPVTMTIRNSNVYEERSLGIYAPSDEAEMSGASSEPLKTANQGMFGPLRRHLTNATLFAETGTRSRSYFVRQQVRSQLAHDLWWICLAVWLIVIIEGSQFATDPVDYSVFNVVFETVSAYGTVGISIGLPNVAYSFCGGWHTLSKLVLCAVMLRGRHRGLPVAIDRAVLLPHESLSHAEEEDAMMKASGNTGQSTGRNILFSPITRRRGMTTSTQPYTLPPTPLQV